jgi:hypothetical protein
MQNLPLWCVRLSVFYAVFGMIMGVVMGSTGDHSLMPVHAHINVLGWVSLALFGIVFKVWNIDTGKLAWTQFGLFNVGIVVQAIGLTLILDGNEAAGPIVGVGSLLLVMGMAVFGWLVLRARQA